MNWHWKGRKKSWQRNVVTKQGLFRQSIEIFIRHARTIEQDDKSTMRKSTFQCLVLRSTKTKTLLYKYTNLSSCDGGYDPSPKYSARKMSFTSSQTTTMNRATSSVPARGP